LAGAGGWRVGRCWPKVTDFQVIRRISPGDLRHSMATRVNNTVGYTWKFLREQILNVLHTHTHKVIM